MVKTFSRISSFKSRKPSRLNSVSVMNHFSLFLLKSETLGGVYGTLSVPYTAGEKITFFFSIHSSVYSNGSMSFLKVKRTSQTLMMRLLIMDRIQRPRSSLTQILGISPSVIRSAVSGTLGCSITESPRSDLDTCL